MSLFEDPRYRWRETFFILLESEDRPTADSLSKSIADLGSKYEVSKIQTDENGLFEALTLKSPYDFSAMDIAYVEGEEVTTQVAELIDDLRDAGLSSAETEKLERLSSCDARFDVFHFEQVDDSGGEGDDIMDPGALLIVLEKVAGICRGISIDPQSGSLM